MNIINHIEFRNGTAYIVGRAVKAKMVARAYIDGTSLYKLNPKIAARNAGSDG